MSARLQRLLILAVGTLVALAMILLGLWQATTYRTQGADATRQRAELPPVTMPSPAIGNPVAELYGRQVTITGEYLPDKQFYIGSKQPMRVATAFRLKDGTTIAVVRGTVEPGQTPASPPKGVITQTGLVMPSEKDRRSLQPSPGLPQPNLPEVRLEHLAQSWPAPLSNGFVTLNAADAAAQSLTPVVVDLPESEGSQRNAGYALQWWVFAVFAMIMTIVWARSVKEPGFRKAPRTRR